MNRSFWILVTYLTRPMMWLVAAAMMALGLFLHSMTSNKYETTDLDVFQSSQPIRTTEELRQAVARAQDDPVVIDWGALAFEQLDQVLPRSGRGVRQIGEQQQRIVNQRLNELPLPENVTSIKTGSWGVDQQLVDRIGKITTLRRLGFLVSSGAEPLDLSPLANLKRLEALDLGIAASNRVSLAPLASLPKLASLSLGSHQWLSKERMAEIAALPALTTLYLPDIPQNQLALVALAELNASSTLRQIRAAVPMDSPQQLARIQATTPNISVTSSKYYPSRHYALIGAIWASLILGTLGMNLAGQLSMPMAQLAPNYQRDHQIVGWTLTAVIAAGLTMVVCYYGAHWFAVVSVVGMCVVLSVAENTQTQLNPGNSRSWRRLTGVLTVAVLGLLVWLEYSRPVLIEAYLLGGPLLLPILFLAITCMAVFRSSVAMNRLARDRIEKGRPLLLSMHDLQRASIDLQNRRRADRDQDSESTVLEPVTRQTRLAAVFAYISLAIAVVPMVVPQSVRDVGVQHYAAMLCCSFACWCIFVVGAKWWQRMPYISAMITRPPLRSVQIDQLFQGVRGDLLRLFPVAVALILVISSAAFFSPDHLGIRLLVSGLFVTCVAVICYASIMWTLMIRSVWGVGALCFVIYLAISMLVASLTVVGWSGQGTLPTYRVLITCGVMALIAIAAMALARRQYQRVEWARFM